MGDVWVEATPPDISWPQLVMYRPRHGDSNVIVSSNIVLEILDKGSGVDASTVVIMVGGKVAWTGDAQQTGFVVTKTVLPGGGLRYSINPDTNFPPGSPVEVDVYAEDLAAAPNVMSARRTFHTGAWV